MKHDQTIADRIIEVVSQSRHCLLEELILACPSLIWNQVFIDVDRLSRHGTLILERKDPWNLHHSSSGTRLTRSDVESMS
jgi:hypothetical protein